MDYDTAKKLKPNDSVTVFEAFMGYFLSKKFLFSAHLRLIVVYIFGVIFLLLSCFLQMQLNNVLLSRMKEYCINKFAFLKYIMCI
jgi:hypothetical protein